MTADASRISVDNDRQTQCVTKMMPYIINRKMIRNPQKK